jgi:hypothetical protein
VAASAIIMMAAKGRIECFNTMGLGKVSGTQVFWPEG